MSPKIEYKLADLKVTSAGKFDLGFERLALGKFAANLLLLLSAMLAFNALCILGQSVLKMKDIPPRKFGTKGEKQIPAMENSC